MPKHFKDYVVVATMRSHGGDDQAVVVEHCESIKEAREYGLKWLDKAKKVVLCRRTYWYIKNGDERSKFMYLEEVVKE